MIDFIPEQESGSGIDFQPIDFVPDAAPSAPQPGEGSGVFLDTLSRVGRGLNTSVGSTVQGAARYADMVSPSHPNESQFFAQKIAGVNQQAFPQGVDTNTTLLQLADVPPDTLGQWRQEYYQQFGSTRDRLNQSIPALMGRQIAQKGQEFYQPNPAMNDTFRAKLAEGAGGTLPTMVAALIPGIGPGVAATAYGLNAGEQGAQEVEQMGGTQYQQDVAFMGNAGIGGLTEGILGVAPNIMRLAKTFSKTGQGLGGAILKSGAREGLQEGSEQALSNLVASDVSGYDPNRPMMQNVPESATLGAVLGALIGGGTKGAQVYQDNAEIKAQEQAPLPTVAELARKRLEMGQMEIQDQAPKNEIRLDTPPQTALEQFEAKQQQSIQDAKAGAERLGVGQPSQPSGPVIPVERNIRQDVQGGKVSFDRGAEAQVTPEQQKRGINPAAIDKPLDQMERLQVTLSLMEETDSNPRDIAKVKKQIAALEKQKPVSQMVAEAKPVVEQAVTAPEPVAPVSEVDSPAEFKPVLDRDKVIDVKKTEAGLPPVKEGFKRLYRAESETAKFDDIFSKSKLEAFKPSKEGKHYTDDLKFADYFRETYGKDAKMTYLDVPVSELNSIRVRPSEFVSPQKAAQAPSAHPLNWQDADTRTPEMDSAAKSAYEAANARLKKLEARQRNIEKSENPSDKQLENLKTIQKDIETERQTLQVADDYQQRPGSSTKLYGGIPFLDPDLIVAGANKVKDVAAKEYHSLKNDVAELLSETPLKSAIEAIPKIWDGVRAVQRATVKTNVERLEALAQKTGSKTLAKLTRQIEPNPLEKDADTGFTTAVQAETKKYHNRMTEALRPIEDILEGMTWKQRVEAMAEIGQAVADPTARVRQIFKPIAAEFQKINRELLEYQKAAGVDIQDAGMDYLVRILDPNLVRNNVAKFIDIAANEYHKAGVKSPAEAAELARDLANRILLEDAGVSTTDGEFTRGDSTGSSLPQAAKARSFLKSADTTLKEFYHRDVYDATALYINRAVKRAEVARRFGDRMKNWADIKGQLIKEGAAEHIPEIVSAISSSIQGVRPPSSRVGRAALSMAMAYGQLSYLSRATISSLVEPMNVMMKTGNVADVFRAYVDTLRHWTPRSAKKALGMKDTLEQERLFAEIGGFSEDLSHVFSASNWAAANPGISRTAQKLTSRYFRKTILTSFTEATRKASLGISQRTLASWAGDVVNKTSYERLSRDSLGQFGIKPGEIQEFHNFAEKVKNNPDALTENSPIAKKYRDAMLRFTESTSLVPNAANKPTWATHPVGSVAFGLQSYLWRFNRQVLVPAVRNATASVRKNDYNAFERAKLITPLALGMPLMLMVTMALNELRHGLFNDPDKSKKPVSDGQRLAEALTRSGFLGKFDTPYNMVTGAKFDRDPATVLVGPYFGAPAELFKAMVDVAGDDNSDNTNKAERKLAKTAYDTLIKPPLTAIAAAPTGPISSVAGAVAIQALAHPATRSAFADVTAGPKQDSSGSGSGRGSNRGNSSRGQSNRSSSRGSTR